MTDEEREKLRVQMIEELRAVVWAYIPIDSKPEERMCTAMFDALATVVAGVIHADCAARARSGAEYVARGNIQIVAFGSRVEHKLFVSPKRLT